MKKTVKTTKKPVEIYISFDIGGYSLGLFGDFSKEDVETVNRIVTSQLRKAGFKVAHGCDTELRGKIKMGR